MRSGKCSGARLPLIRLSCRTCNQNGKIVPHEHTINPIQSRSGLDTLLSLSVNIARVCTSVARSVKNDRLFCEVKSMQASWCNHSQNPCERLGVTMGKTPVSTEDWSPISVITHKKFLNECAGPKSNRFLDCLHCLVTGKFVVRTQLQKHLD